MPRDLGKLVRFCLQKDPGHRLQAALDVRNELEEIGREAAARTAVQETTPSIAVLPFADMSRDKDQDYFCEGIAEEIINALTGIRGLRVASRTSAFQFKAAALESREIGRRLRVTHLLEGSVRKAGERLRITVELTDVAGNYNLWSERYDRKMEDIFAIQEEIAHSVATALQVTLTQKERDALQQKHTTDVKAYDYYLRGRKFYYQFRTRGIEFALEMFARAIAIDPGYGLAYAGIADCHSFLYNVSVRSEENRRKAEDASRKALDLAPGLAQVHTSRGVTLSLSGRHDEAEREFETAISLDPTLFEAHYFYARDCFTQGHLEKAAQLYERAGAVRPEDYQSPLLVAQIYADLGREDAARESRLRGLRVVEERLKLNPDDARAVYMGANALVSLGEMQRGLEWARRAVAMEPEDPMVLYNVACIKSLSGQVEEAIDCLEKAVRNGHSQKDWYQRDSNLDLLRAHPRFQALMKKIE
jgi:TolB-like protein/Flp pilus assembly protein TadD